MTKSLSASFAKWSLAALVLALGAVLAVPEAEARRFGGARSLGVQRSIPKTPPTAAPAKPAQQQAAPAGSQQAAPAAGSRWAPMLGGLALGGMLGYLFAGNGLGGLLLIALLAFAAVMAFRVLARGAARPAPQRMQYAGLGQEAVAPPSQPAGRQPAASQGGSEAEAFLKGAKANFLKLQLANEARQWDDIREFTTDEMFAALREDAAAGGERTEVMSLSAELVDVATEGDRHWASVRFSGLVREAQGAQPATFAEVWNLVKPADGSSGWLLAGIQQVH